MDWAVLIAFSYDRWAAFAGFSRSKILELANAEGVRASRPKRWAFFALFFEQEPLGNTLYISVSATSGKIPVFLTATQLDLLGDALIERIPQVADRVSKAAKTGTSLEEVALLQAYLELAKIIMEPHNGPKGHRGASQPLSRVSKQRINGPSALQSAALHLRQP